MAALPVSATITLSADAIEAIVRELEFAMRARSGRASPEVQKMQEYFVGLLWELKPDSLAFGCLRPIVEKYRQLHTIPGAGKGHH